MSEYIPSRRGYRQHPKTMERYRYEWQSKVRYSERHAQWALDGIEKAIERYKADPGHTGWADQIHSQADRLRNELLEADKYQRLLDGRPTLTEDRDAAIREYEAKMNAEYQREVSGGWAHDEFNASYDDVRERFHSSY